MLDSKVLSYVVALTIEQYGDNGNYKNCVFNWFLLRVINILKEK